MRTSHLLLAACLCGASAPQAARVFVHPGAMNTQAELDFVKAKVAAQAEPWTSKFKMLRTVATGPISALITLDPNGNEANTSKADARRAYANALLWAYSGDSAYAKRAIAFLKAWSVLEEFTGGNDQDKLQAGWIGALFGPAAEIMNSYPEWSSADKDSLRSMFKRAFYPQLVVASTWNGNVDLTQIDAMMSIAVFNEDEALFDSALARLKRRNPAYFYLAADNGVPSIAGDGGNIPAFWSNPTKWLDGLTQESCRDNAHHAQYALASALHAAEIAWHQGVDVYSENKDRYVATLELMATQLLTGGMQGVCKDTVTTADRYATWEVGYNHFHNRKGILLPKTSQLLLEQIRPKGTSDWNIFYETLTHAEISAPVAGVSPVRQARSPISLESLVDGNCLIRTEQAESVDLVVTSPDGKARSRTQLEAPANQPILAPLGLERAPKGLYLVQARTNSGTVSIKVVR